jgi:ribosomal-protein-alanine N-acetyltransferase
LLRPGDADAIYAYLRNPLVTDLTSFPPVSLALAEALIERSLARWAAGEPARWGLALGPADQLIGTCGFVDWSRDHQWADLAYDLAPDHWGKGLMGRAVAAVVEWAFRDGLVDRVQAFVRVDNVRSSRVLERAGFAREGCLRGYRVCRGQRHDFYVYGRLRSDSAAAYLASGH